MRPEVRLVYLSVPQGCSMKMSRGGRIQCACGTARRANSHWESSALQIMKCCEPWTDANPWACNSLSASRSGMVKTTTRLQAKKRVYMSLCSVIPWVPI
jgi:hypothetical protein